MPVELPRTQIAALQELATRLIDKRPAGSDMKTLARELFRGFYEACVYMGLDRVLVAFEATDRHDFEENEALFTGLLARIDAIKLDGGGPRNAKPAQLAECVVGALGATVVDEPDRSITLGDDVRSEVVAAIASILNVELAAAKLRETIVAEARARCDEAHAGVFSRVVAQLDDRGIKLVKTPKVSVESLHAIERNLFDAREAVFTRVAGVVLDRVKPILARADAEAANRLDAPISLKTTPRDATILRACDVHLDKNPTAMGHALLLALTQLVPIAWRAAEQTAIPYAASKTFNVGDLIDHPKFGRGSVVASLATRIDVEFPTGKFTLIHVPPRR